MANGINGTGSNEPVKQGGKTIGDMVKDLEKRFPNSLFAKTPDGDLKTDTARIFYEFSDPDANRTSEQRIRNMATTDGCNEDLSTHDADIGVLKKAYQNGDCSSDEYRKSLEHFNNKSILRHEDLITDSKGNADIDHLSQELGGKTIDELLVVMDKDQQKMDKVAKAKQGIVSPQGAGILQPGDLSAGYKIIHGITVKRKF